MKVVVIGMHRSGTSITAQILQKLGVNMGEALLGSTISNVDGHFEDLEIVEKNNLLFSTLEAEWDAPPSLEKVLNSSEKISEVYNDFFNKKRNGSWGFKDPKTTILLPALILEMEDFLLIYCKRNISDVANSLKIRDSMESSVSIKLKATYDFFADYSYCKHKGLKLIVNYEELLSDTDVVVKSIANKLGIDDESKIEIALMAVRRKDSLNSAKKIILYEDIKISIKKFAKTVITNPLSAFAKIKIATIKKWISIFRDIK